MQSYQQRNPSYRGQQPPPRPPQPKKSKVGTEKIIIGILCVFLIIAMVVSYNSSQKHTALVQKSEEAARISNQEAKDYKIQAYKLREMNGNIWHTIKQDLGDMSNQVIQAKIMAIDSLMTEIIKDTELKKADFDNYATQLVFAYEDIFSLSNDIRNKDVQKQVQEGLQENRQLISELRGKIRDLQTENMQQKNELARLKGERQTIIASKEEMKQANESLSNRQEQLEQENSVLESQKSQLTNTARMVEPRCFFWYRPDKNNSERIDLTGSGLSKKYLKYFMKTRPDIEIEFLIEPQLFTNNTALKIYLFDAADEDGPINMQTVPIGTSKLSKKLTTSGMETGSYYIIIEDDNGENITRNGQYNFSVI